MKITIDPAFRRFVEQELLADLPIEPTEFWQGLDHLVHTHGPENRRLLKVRNDLQNALDDYQRSHSASDWDADNYRAFLQDLGYLEPPASPFCIDTTDVDDEIAFSIRAHL